MDREPSLPTLTPRRESGTILVQVTAPIRSKYLLRLTGCAAAPERLGLWLRNRILCTALAPADGQLTHPWLALRRIASISYLQASAFGRWFAWEPITRFE